MTFHCQGCLGSDFQAIFNYQRCAVFLYSRSPVLDPILQDLCKHPEFSHSALSDWFLTDALSEALQSRDVKEVGQSIFLCFLRKKLSSIFVVFKTLQIHFRFDRYRSNSNPVCLRYQEFIFVIYLTCTYCMVCMPIIVSTCSRNVDRLIRDISRHRAVPATREFSLHGRSDGKWCFNERF